MDHRRRSGSSSLRPAALLCAVVAASAAPAFAAAPLLYDEPFHQSPVRGEPDDLLMLPGSGFAPGDVVVYRRLVNTTLPLAHPSSVPPTSTAIEGVADVVAYGNVPDSLTVKLHPAMLSGFSYGLWVLNLARASPATQPGLRAGTPKEKWEPAPEGRSLVDRLASKALRSK